jgi:hypothetical protein
MSTGSATPLCIMASSPASSCSTCGGRSRATSRRSASTRLIVAGLGTRLIGFAEERIFREWPNVFLCVSSFNPDARRLYERLGYQAIGTLTDYIVAGCDEILMRKTRGPLDGYRP